jgi:hypothetical protein
VRDAIDRERISEDETDGESKHCEFAAVSRRTRKKYWVEAKVRSVVSVLGKTDKDGGLAIVSRLRLQYRLGVISLSRRDGTLN